MKCACCEQRNSEAKIDFHHWDYINNIGIHLCRECHTYIHEGKRARSQTAESPKGEDWRIPTVNRLIGLHEQIHGRANTWDEFFERYNIPRQDVFMQIYELDL